MVNVYRDYHTAVRYASFVAVNCFLFYTREREDAVRNRERLLRRWRKELATKRSEQLASD
eukprot:jgi/Galph1/5271/GphlegSOOS_G4000.1